MHTSNNNNDDNNILLRWILVAVHMWRRMSPLIRSLKKNKIQSIFDLTQRQKEKKSFFVFRWSFIAWRQMYTVDMLIRKSLWMC